MCLTANGWRMKCPECEEVKDCKLRRYVISPTEDRLVFACTDCGVVFEVGHKDAWLARCQGELRRSVW